MASDELTRRGFLGGAAAVAAGLVACGDDETGASGGGGGGGTSGGEGGSGATGTTTGSSTTTAGPGGGGPGTGGGDAGTGGAGGASGSGGGGGATPACEETEDDIEGPFYTEGAPIVDGALPGADELPGVAIRLEGRVFSAASCEPLAGATLDIWQADDEGVYDNVGYTLRGRVVTDADGRYAVRTLVPGNYLNGAQYRPAHIHVKASAPDHGLLTTQLYFPDDPYNDIDPWFDERLLVAISDPGDGTTLATFDFVIA